MEGGNVVATGSNDADGNVVFSSITYTQPGSHVYTVREVKGGETGVTYDDHSYLVYTQITDNGDGTLGVTHQAVSSEENDELIPAEGNTVTFSITFTRQNQGYRDRLEAVKKLTGKEI